MPESARTRLKRWGFNLFPAYWATGARIEYVADDFREIRVRVPLSLRTRNYVGTLFGGSMYGAVDPVYMLMLIHVLGPEYTVWDKAAAIRFRKPGRSTLFARFLLDDAELEAIRAATAAGEPTDRVYRVELVDAAGVMHAEVEKTVYVRRRDAQRRGRPAAAAARTEEG